MPPRRRRWYHMLGACRASPTYPVLISGHCLIDRMIPLNIPEEDVEAAVRFGPFLAEKCAQPDKLVFRTPGRKWKGKYMIVVTRFRKTHIKVVTVYPQE